MLFPLQAGRQEKSMTAESNQALGRSEGSNSVCLGTKLIAQSYCLVKIYNHFDLFGVKEKNLIGKWANQ